MNKISKADIHIHTTFSDGLNEPEDVVNYVVSHTDLSVIAITDHNTIDGARSAYAYWQKHRAEFDGLEIIKGVEISSSDGHILGLFLEEDIPRNMSPADTVAAIHEQGGLAIAAHPFTHLLPFTDFHGIGRRIAHLPLDGVEERSSVPTEIYANVMTAVYNRRHANHATLGSSDAHYLTMIGKTYTLFSGQTARDFRQAVEQKQVKAGGRVNGPIAVGQVVNHLIRRRQLPVFLPNDQYHRHEQFGLTIDVTEERWGPVATMRCRGDLVAGNADMLKSQGLRLLASGQSHLVIDLDAIQFIDSSGIGAMLALQKQMQQAGGEVFLSSLNRQVALTLQLVRLDKLFQVFDSTAEALTAVTESSPAVGYQYT
jgi:hypothetical protein